MQFCKDVYSSSHLESDSVVSNFLVLWADTAVGGRVLAGLSKASVGLVFRSPSFVYSARTSHLRCATLSFEMLAATRPWTAAPHPINPEYPTLFPFRRERCISFSGDTRVCLSADRIRSTPGEDWCVSPTVHTDRACRYYWWFKFFLRHNNFSALQIPSGCSV